MEDLVDLYSGVVTCPLQCEKVINDPGSGVIPRGFFTQSKPESVEILVVAKNPGHPKEQESSLYRNKSGPDAVRCHLEFVHSLFFPPNGIYTRDLTIQKNTVRYLRYFLGDIPPTEVFQRAAYTNLVKCSFSGAVNEKLPKSTIDTCVSKHFLEEVNFFKPKVILACGREVEETLRKILGEKLPIIYIKHPSYYYRKEMEPEILAEIRREIRQFIHQ